MIARFFRWLRSLFVKEQPQVPEDWKRKHCKSCRYYDGKMCHTKGERIMYEPMAPACPRWAKRRWRASHAMGKTTIKKVK